MRPRGFLILAVLTAVLVLAPQSLALAAPTAHPRTLVIGVDHLDADNRPVWAELLGRHDRAREHIAVVAVFQTRPTIALVRTAKVMSARLCKRPARRDVPRLPRTSR